MPYVAREPIYTRQDGTPCAPDDPAVFQMLVRAGGVVPDDDAERLNLKDHAALVRIHTPASALGEAPPERGSTYYETTGTEPPETKAQRAAREAGAVAPEPGRVLGEAPREETVRPLGAPAAEKAPAKDEPAKAAAAEPHRRR